MNDSKNKQNLGNIMKQLDKAKIILIIQSDIENYLKISSKSMKDEKALKEIENTIGLVNSKIFSHDELINDVTKPMKLHDYTLNILFNKVIQGDPITPDMVEEINDCY